MQSLVSSSVTTGSGAGGSHEAASICCPGSGAWRGERVAWGEGPGGGPSPAAGTGGAEHLPSAPPGRAGEDRRAAGGSASGAGAGDGQSLGKPRAAAAGPEGRPHPHPDALPLPALPPPPGARRSPYLETLLHPDLLHASAEPRWPGHTGSGPAGRQPAPGGVPAVSTPGGQAMLRASSTAGSRGRRREEEGARQVGLSGGLEL